MRTERDSTSVFAASFLLAYIAIVALALLLIGANTGHGAEIQRPTLTYVAGQVKPFVAENIAPDATFICIEYASLDQPGYTPSKCLNFAAGTLKVWRNDWRMVNCTIDQVMAGDDYCGDDKEWDVRVYTESPDPNSRTYSTTTRLVYKKPITVIR